MKKRKSRFRRRLGWGLLLLLLAFVGLLLFRTARFASRQVSVPPVQGTPVPAGAIDRLAASLRLPTISPEDPADFDSTHFFALDTLLQRSYPLADSLLAPRSFNKFSRLYHWPGRQPELPAALFLAHHDVVGLSLIHI